MTLGLQSYLLSFGMTGPEHGTRAPVVPPNRSGLVRLEASLTSEPEDMPPFQVTNKPPRSPTGDAMAVSYTHLTLPTKLEV